MSIKNLQDLLNNVSVFDYPTHRVRQPSLPLDLYGAISRVNIRSTATNHNEMYKSPDPRVREEALAQRREVAAQQLSDPRVLGVLAFACGMLGSEEAGLKLTGNISLVVRRNQWLNVMWKSEHAADTFGPVIDIAWQEFSGFKHVSHSWPGKLE